MDMSLTRFALAFAGATLAVVGGIAWPAPGAAASALPDLAAVTYTAATPGSCTDSYEKIATSEGSKVVRVIECDSVPANIVGDGLAIRLPGGSDYPYQVTFDNLTPKLLYNWVRRTTAGFSDWNSGWSSGSTTHDCSDTGDGRRLGCIIGANAAFNQTVKIKATVSLK